MEPIIPPGKQVYIMRPCMIHGPGNKGNLNLLYNVGQDALFAIFLQGTATKLQELGEFLVGEVSLPIQRWAVGLDE